MKQGRNMKPVTKIQFFDENGEKFFGEGPCRLLRLVEEFKPQVCFLDVEMPGMTLF